MSLALAPAISFCHVDGARIFLDLDRDRYVCLGKAADAAFDALIKGRRSAEVDDEKIDYLVAAGILIEQEFGEAPRPCRGVAIDRAPLADEHAADVAPTRVIRTALALQLAKRRYRREGLPRLWKRLKARKAAEYSSLRVGRARELQEIAYRFEAAGRMVGSLNQCVPYSASIARACLSAGIEVELVLGVKLRPFEAHAWTVANRTLLSDHLTTVAQFTPIAIL
jgi:hypothetical protein